MNAISTLERIGSHEISESEVLKVTCSYRVYMRFKDGFDYNVDHNNAYIADPVLNFNLGKWLIDNTDFTF